MSALDKKTVEEVTAVVQNNSLHKSAKILGCGFNTLKKFMAKHGIDREYIPTRLGRPKLDIDFGRIRTLRAKGYTYPQIAAELGVGLSTVVNTVNGRRKNG